MVESSASNWLIFVGIALTWVLFFLGVGVLARFYSKFVETYKELDVHLINLNAQLKKIQSSLAEVAIEQRRSSRLMLEQVDLKKAEMTGDFEIVEEPIPAPVQAPATPGISQLERK